jgi:pimeloyl-ACP methyl ester carboxylesterase
VGLPLVLVCGWLVSSAAVVWVTTTRRRPVVPEAPPVGVGEWGAVETVRLRTSDGQELGAWFAPGEPGRAAAVLLHGNGGSRTGQVELMNELMANGYGCLAVTLRAHGDSTGEENDFGWSARHDVLAATEFVERRRPGESIVLVGTSMGAVASIFAAGELGARVGGYLLEAPYRDLISAVEDRTVYYLPPGLDRLAFEGLRLWGPAFLEADPEIIRPIDYVGQFPPEVAAIFLAAGEDPMAPPGDVRELERLCSANSRLEMFPGVGHVELFRVDPERYTALVRALLDGG